MSQNLVAIVVPCYKRELSATERIAYRRLWELYSHLPIVMMAPPWLDVSDYVAEHPSLKVERFEFLTVRDYSQLLLQSHFYERFRDFHYILIYQLDCYFLRDELLEWCQRGYDYIGSPLFHGYEPPQPEGKLWCVGNGGFSLRNVEAALKVLASRKRYLTPIQYWAQTPSEPGLFSKITRFFSGLLRLTRIHNDIRWATLSNFNEDIFWSINAPHFWPGFKLPDLKTGLQFAFDYAPAHCYEQAGHRLPFACHAWQRYDLPFWQKFIPEAATLPVPSNP